MAFSRKKLTITSSNAVANEPITKAVMQVRAREYAVRCILELANQLKSKNEHVRYRAAIALLDRAYGRPAQMIASEGGESIFPGIQVTLVKPGDDDKNRRIN